jgi:hypothetical protein
VRVLPTEALPPTSHEEPPNEENRAIVDAVFPMDGPKSIVGGEAVVFLYRLDPIPGVLKPGQDRIDYKSSGRNAAITRDGPHMRWRGTGFRWSGADAQRRDWLHPGPDLVRVSEPGAAPLLEAVTIVEDFDNEGFGKGYLHFDHQFRRAQFEFFEERFVRVIRVKLVPGSTTPVP